jgi:hypothetical protein
MLPSPVFTGRGGSASTGTASPAIASVRIAPSQKSAPGDPVAAACFIQAATSIRPATNVADASAATLRLAAARAKFQFMKNSLKQGVKRNERDNFGQCKAQSTLCQVHFTKKLTLGPSASQDLKIG